MDSDLVIMESDPDGTSRRRAVPRSVVDAVGMYLANFRGEPSVEHVRAAVRLDVVDGVGNEEIDIVLGWLEEEGILVKSRDRTLFLTESCDDVRAAVSKVWSALPTK